MQKKYLYIITIAYACAIFAQGVFTPIYAFFVQNIGGGILETAWAISLFSIVTGITAMVIHHTKWSHRYRNECLWVGWLIWVFGLALYFYMQSFYMLFVSQALTGFGNALSEPAFDAEFSEQVAADPSGGWSIFEGVTNIFYGVAAFLGGIIAKKFGFEVLIYFMVATAIISFCCIIWYLYVGKKRMIRTRS